MKKIEAEFRANGTSHFGLTTSNLGGIEVAVRNDDELAYCDWCGEKPEYCSRWQTIKYDNNGRMFFYWHGRKKYLDNFMKID